MKAGKNIAGLSEKVNLRKATFIFFDILAFTVSLPVAYSVKFEYGSAFPMGSNIILLLPLFITVKLIVFNRFKIYDITWRFISI